LDLVALIAEGVELENNAVSDVARRTKQSHLSGGENRCASEIYDYVMERLRGYYLEGTTIHITTEMFDAVLANRPASLLDFDQRLRALVDFLKLDDAQSLAAANKRINNILKKNSEGNERSEVDETLLKEPAEQALYRQLRSAEDDTAPLFAAENYGAALSRLAVLRAEVDAFFDSVMVMADEKSIRDNRLALLRRLRNVFLQVADLSRLPG
jgi:glycyl-tRNA synthetase beta chain